jgi:4-amino-4-deoxy-L-arabinose transferase-like glycosyltransferase
MQNITEFGRPFLRRFIEARYFVSFCVATGGLLRLLWICVGNTELTRDALWYDRLAASIVSGHGYYVNGHPFAYWPIGYPGFLAALYYLFGHSLLVAKLANVILSLATLLLTYFVSNQIFRSEFAARIALGILCFSPNQIAYTDLLLTETLLSFLLILGAALFVAARDRLRWVVLAGVAWGLATLTKTQAALVPVIVLLAFMTDLRSLMKRGAVVGLTLAVIVAPGCFKLPLARNRITGRPWWDRTIHG